MNFSNLTATDTIKLEGPFVIRLSATPCKEGDEEKLMLFTCALAASGAVIAAIGAQEPFREYPSVEYGDIYLCLRTGTNRLSSFSRALCFPAARLMGINLPAGSRDLGKRAFRSGRRIIRVPIALLPRRCADLTRVDVRSVEQPVNPDDGDDIYNWPFIYAVQVGEWGSPSRRPGSCASISFAAASLWPMTVTAARSRLTLMKTMKMVFPERELVEIPDRRSHLSHLL